ATGDKISVQATDKRGNDIAELIYENAHATGDKISVQATDKRGDNIEKLICDNGSI
ncbi:unnamed protein product, partial [Adineta steineri]